MTEFSIDVAVSHMLAASETAHSKHEFITPDHLFSGLTKLEDALHPSVIDKIGLPPHIVPVFQAEAVQLLRLLGEFQVEPRSTRHRMRELIGKGNHERAEREHISRSPESREVFERATQIAQEAESPDTAVQHLLAALLEREDGHTHQLLTEMGVDIEGLREAAKALDLPEVESSPTPYLDQFGTDLVQLAGEGALSPTIGRRQEMMQVVRTLSREKKNNPILIGEAGVGKTAIVEGLAQRIFARNIHPDLQDKRIVQISAADLVAGTKYRGEFEERMKHLIAEAAQCDHLILFIDEIHMLVGAGSGGSGAMDAANILKPALARGDLKLIGATTSADYRKYIEKDAALERRFEPIRVKEPTPEETEEILRQVSKHLAQHHQVTIRGDAITAAVQLSVRYIPQRRLPDKAYDLLDEGCAWARYGSQISYNGDGELADVAFNLVTEDTIREVLSEKTGIPLSRLTEQEAHRITQMADALRKRVIGQDNALDVVVSVIQRHYAGLHEGKRPVGVFLFVGPTGVGKTELAKAVAQFLFGSDRHVIRLDMGEFTEKHNLARLIGAPPGYVGYEEGGQLTEALRQNPYAVVLLDEVEKAHPDVLNTLLSLFGEGRLSDGHGRTVDGSNALFVMTSNLGYPQPSETELPDDLPSPPTETEIRRAIYGCFRPEFLNRIDEIVFFQPLREEQMVDVVKIQLARIEEILSQRDISLQVADDVVHWLAQRGYNPQLGARPLIRTVEKELLNKIGGLLLSGDLKETHEAWVRLEQDELQVTAIGRDTI